MINEMERIMIEVPQAADPMGHALQMLEEANAQAEQVDGKRYTTVARRVEVFRRAFGPTAAIHTEILDCDDHVVRCKASIMVPQGGDFLLVATGHSEEWRNSSDINRSSALENAETSAIGRALAALGLHGGQFASAEELAAAQKEREELEKREATSFLTAEDISNAITKVQACKTESELAEAYLTLSPALKIAVRYVQEAKLKALRSAAPTGSEPGKESSPPAPSAQQPASPRRRGRSSGVA
jgi:hypothetical protein